MKKIVLLLLIVYCLFSTVPFVQADYVLPYPSFMPGNKMYRVSRIIDRMKEYWYFGNIAKTKYHLALADKYLVEAKTLFEYKQYLLATDALKRSDGQFQQVPQFVKAAQNEGKDMTQFIGRIDEASKKHIVVLEEFWIRLPDEFEWKPEKGEATMLSIHELIRESKSIRRAVGDVIAGKTILP